jgi:glycosyltransferase involved in cell wall biosynthesis
MSGPPEVTNNKWFTAIPMNYSDDPAFWSRDGGLMCLGLRKAGFDSRFVALGKPCVREDLPLVLGTLEQFHDPAWWSQLHADGVFLTSWGAPRFEGIARAIKQSGALLAIRLDSAGAPSPRVNFRRYLQITYSLARDTGRKFPGIYSLAKTLLFRFSRRAFDIRFCQHLSHADLIVIESPLARQALCRYLRLLGYPDIAERVCVLFHPLLDSVSYNRNVRKLPRIIAVGRWDAHAKDAPRLMKVLATVLPQRSSCDAVLFGSGEKQLAVLRDRLPKSIQSRISILGAVSRDALCEAYQASQVILIPSRYESGPMAAAEALCCGCSVVGSALLPSVNFMCSQGSGTLSASRSVGDLSDALALELHAWSAGRRDPSAISRAWIDRVSVSAVVRDFLLEASKPLARSIPAATVDRKA